MTCYEAWDTFVVNQEVVNNSVNTVDFYKKRIGYFIDFVDNKDVSLLCLDDYNNFAFFLKSKESIKGGRLSSYTIKTTLNATKIFLKFCFDKKYITDDFYKEIKPYKSINKIIVVLSPEEIQKLLDTQNTCTRVGMRNLLIIALMLDAGLRVSEVSHLNFDDINVDLGVIRVLGKGNKERLVPITDFILNYYKKYVYLSGIKHGALILDFEKKERLSPSGISQIFRRIRQRYNFRELHPHFLRHTFATLFLVNGGDPIHLQMILGHTTLYMTEQYIHLANQMTLTKQKKYSPLTNIKKA